MAHRTHAALFVFAFAACLSAQATHVVQGGGAALQVAVNAAAPGDILDVMPGYYSPVTARRGVRILMRAGANVGTQTFLVPAFTITALPANEAFVIAGGTCGAVHAIDCSGAVVCHRLDYLPHFSGDSRIERCSGPVFWQRVVIPYGPHQNMQATFVIDSAQVSFTSCDLDRLVVTNSRVSLTDTRIAAPNGAHPAIDVLSGSVAIAGGHFVGGTQHSLVFAPGFRLAQGDLVLTGGAHVESSWPTAANAAIATTGGAVRIDPSVVLVGTPPIGGSALVTSAYTPNLAATHAPGTSGCQLAIAAEPNSVVFTLANLPTSPLPSPWGELWLVPQSPILDVAVLPPTGARTFAFTLGPVPPLLGIVVQSATLSPSGVIAVGVPVRFVWD